MYSIFRIEEYNPQTEQIRVRFCEEQSHYPIGKGKSVMIDCKALDCYNASTFAFSLMKSYGESRIRKQKDKQPVLSENMGGEIEGKLNIQDLVGKIIKVKNQPRTMNILKVKEVSL
tara:strand:+ start:1070 stop:1417 length:348 start_codon:yes stop_codon:yes gene_type:complete